MRKIWTDKEKRKVVERCNSAKENGEKSGDILKELGASTSQLCQWRKKFNNKTNLKPRLPVEILDEFGVEPFQPDIESEEIEDELEKDITEDGRININEYSRRESIAKNLFMSGYTIWQTVENGQFFINFQKD